MCMNNHSTVPLWVYVAEKEWGYLLSGLAFRPYSIACLGTAGQRSAFIIVDVHPLLPSTRSRWRQS
jgi:hypothetical protein